MFKKLSASIFALALVAGAFVPAFAQDTVGIYFDDPVNGLQRWGNTVAGTPFDVVVVTKTSQGSAAGEFVMTELTVAAPGVFKLSTVKIFNTPLELGDNSIGEYLMAYGDCAAAGAQEIVRLNYGEFAGTVGPDTILQIRGFQPGDSQPSTFGGEMGYIDCTPAPNGVGYILTGEPWPAGTNIDPTKGPSGVPSGDGVCVINADSVPNEVDSVSSLKGRF